MLYHFFKFLRAWGFLLIALIAFPVGAAHLTVNTLSGADDGTDGVCSLREAITAANSNRNYNECIGKNYDADSITFSVDGTILLDTTLPPIVSGSILTIDGSGRSVTVSSNGSLNINHYSFRVMAVNNEATLTLQNITIAQSLPHVLGGGVFNQGTLTVSSSTFSGNKTLGGGGIQNQGLLTVSNSTFSGNVGEISGGGIYNTGTGTVTYSTFSGNAADISGGIDNFGTLTVSNSTFSNNIGAMGDGGIDNSGTLTVSNSTFSGNVSLSSGAGGIGNYGLATVSNTTFSGNGHAYLPFYGTSIINRGSLDLANTILANSTGVDCWNSGTLNAT